MAMPLGLEGKPESLQARIQHWHESQDITALTDAAPVVCIQLGRYVDAGKLRNQIDLPEKSKSRSLTRSHKLSGASTRW